MTMPAGRYYIGDLCYVMDRGEWDEFCALTIGQDQSGDGEFVFEDGRRFATYGTTWGDGLYRSNIGTEHSVDAGLIGCIRIQDITANKYDDLESLGAIVDFDHEFDTSTVNGCLRFGHVVIDTNAEEADD